MKKKSLRLRLNAEAIRTLNDGRLNVVAGGKWYTESEIAGGCGVTQSCRGTCADSCYCEVALGARG
jgi:hypothetical protein